MNAPARFVTEKGQPLYGITAEFATPAAVYHAAETIRDAGYRAWDVYAPFPIHGIDEAMGIKRTKLPLIVGAAAAVGVLLGYLLQWWGSNVGYQTVVQGKPFGSVTEGGWESFVPITFEVGVLLGSFATLIGMLALNGLPRHHHPLMKKDRFLRTSDDLFMICIESKDEKFDPDRVKELLKSAGGTNLDLVEDK
ncbi:MAG: DUF3341 domain-containing protein [Phycisphaeraceae bacterium]|nr:MAG: DUF3341 domain-containing protein [Phycisphaeraceae bacterium]